MLNRTDRFMQYAREARTNSNMSTKVGATLTRGSRVLRSGYNIFGKAKYLGGWSLHAEVAATINVNAEASTLYVYREHATLKAPLLAKPCNQCIEWLTKLGVKEVVYSTPEYPHYKTMELF